jgi:hypothetical protein
MRQRCGRVAAQLEQQLGSGSGEKTALGKREDDTEDETEDERPRTRDRGRETEDERPRTSD